MSLLFKSVSTYFRQYSKNDWFNYFGSTRKSIYYYLNPVVIFF